MLPLLLGRLRGPLQQAELTFVNAAWKTGVEARICSAFTLTGSSSTQQRTLATPSQAQQAEASPSRAGSTAAQGQRKQRAPRKPPIEGRKVSTTAPWPFIDPTRPQILPKFVPVGQPAALPLQEAISQIKAKVAARASGTAEVLSKSGRPRRTRTINESIELIMQFLTDPRKADHMVRGTVVLPHGTGKKVRVAVFARGADADAARVAGADVVGGEDLIQEIIDSNGASINFDQVIATPDFMKPLARAGKVLGPKGLMPNPKMGTLTADVVGAIKLVRTGRLEFKIGRDRQIAATVGKAAFDQEQLVGNLSKFISTVLEHRPKSLPGQGVQGFISGILLKSTMTSPVRVDLKSCEQLARAAA